MTATRSGALDLGQGRYVTEHAAPVKLLLRAWRFVRHQPLGTGKDVPLRPDAIRRATVRMAALISAVRIHRALAESVAAPIFTWLRR